MRYQKKQTALRAVTGVFLIVELFFSVVTPVLALKIPSVSSVATQLEQRYNMNLGSVQDLGQSFNVANDKKLTPEVSLFFSPSDPKPGAKLSAKALPVYFSNTNEAMYYTWYLKHTECDLTSSPSAEAQALCDRDNDGRITVEDWKIEAMQILAQNGFERTNTNYSSDDDNDGYHARFGGDNKINTPNHCYIHDNGSGAVYELGSGSDLTFGCPSGTSPVCMVEDQDTTSGVNSPDGNFFDETNSGTCSVSGTPSCSSGSAVCGTGNPRCVADPTTTTSCGSAITSCSTSSKSSAAPYCKHLFPNANGRTSGDGSFGATEESFWGTDPHDPDTSDNGNKDEANIVGLGQTSFSWNYATGDQVGVVVEGTSMIPTKHDDSSYMIMWAFSKNDCPLSLASNVGSYAQSIRGYTVNIPTADLNLNDCLERNLVDPAQGGQATNLDVSVTAIPDDPLNDATGDKSGDIVIAQASIGNGGDNIANTLYEWTVEISDNAQFSSIVGETANITSDLQTLGLLGNTRGNALDALRLKLDIPSTFAGRTLADYLSGEMGYLRFSVRATENFASGISRKGRSSVIVKFISTARRITAYAAQTTVVGSATHVVLPESDGIICNGSTFERSVCRVTKNEVIGLRIDPSGLDNFHWTINGQSLTCTEKSVSPDCDDDKQNHVNFFPVTGNPGDTYTVSLTANDIQTGKTLTLSRTFHVVDPVVSIVSRDQATAWPKLIGQYRDLTGSVTNCPGGLCNDYSTSILQGFSGSTFPLRAEFIPGFLGNSSRVTREWTVDNGVVVESAPGEINFLATKEAPGIYNVSVGALYVQSDSIRRALLDIWNISPLDSPEIRFANTIQIEVEDPNTITENSSAQKKFFAAIVSALPASVIFAFRILLFAALVLFTTGLLFAVFPERSVKKIL